MQPRMGASGALLSAASLIAFGALDAECPDYSAFARTAHPPLSAGTHRLGSMRPAPACRTFASPAVEAEVERMSRTIADPDLARLFANAYPNTLDTAIRWRGVAANNSAEELTFVITGDINAMWLRDSANQMQSYLSVLGSPADKDTGGPGDSVASLFRGVVNLQARYLLTSPFCNSFQPPAESGIPPATNDAARTDSVRPTYSPDAVFECKYELDSLAAFLQVSTNYFEATRDAAFFGSFQWLAAVQAVLQTAEAMLTPTYGPDGSVLTSPYMFARTTSRSTETLANDGLGSPVGSGTGLIRSAFRPSDDSTIFQLFIPANMMFSRYLGSAAAIVAALGSQAPAGLAQRMRDLRGSVRAAIEKHGIVADARANGTVFAYEVDGFGSSVIMDDANIPSLLAAPFIGYLNRTDPVYQRTRAVILNQAGPNGNPYFMRGPALSAVGGPHNGPPYAWPMASIVRILTSEDDAEIVAELRQLVSSTDGIGLMHESVNSFVQSDWTRQWFSWANGLFGQMILDLSERKPHILKQSFQS